MAGQKQETFEPVSLGHIRSHGVAALSCWCCRVGRLALKQLLIG